MSMRPYVVEFTGTPEAGKTSTIKEIIPIISKKLNCKIAFVQESAEILPSTFSKGSFEACLWMIQKTISSLLIQLSDSSNSIIILDRGLIDADFFVYKFYQEGYCSKADYKLYKSSKVNIITNLCIVLKTSVEESIRRRGGEGRIVTLDWVKNYNSLWDNYFYAFNTNSTATTFFTIDTTNLSQSTVSRIISNKIIASYKKDST